MEGDLMYSKIRFFLKAQEAEGLKWDEWLRGWGREVAVSTESREPWEAYVMLMVHKHHLAIVQSPCSFMRV